MKFNRRYLKPSLQWSLAAAVAGLMVACGSDNDDSSTEVADSNSDKPMTTTEDVAAQYVKMAHAVYTDSLTTAQALKTSVDTLLAEPTEANLTAARAAYKAARVPYQQSEIMRWDTPITINQNLEEDGGLSSVDDWEGQVNAWPLDENHIVQIIASDQAINTQLLLDQNGVNGDGSENEANVTTGVHAIEFMLWGEDFNGTQPGAGNQSALVFDVENCPDTLCERRAQYLNVATNLLVNDLTEMAAEWSQEAADTQGTLAYNFINSDLSLDYIWGSMQAMAGEELAGARMNSGITTGDPEEEHDCFSDLSHVAIFYNFMGIKNAFFGDYGDVTGPGIGDLVKEKDEATYNLVVEKLNAIEASMQTLLDLGERTENPIRFDQIIGQDEKTGAERKIAVTAVNDLISFSVNELTQVKELLSLTVINTGGGGDGD